MLSKSFDAKLEDVHMVLSTKREAGIYFILEKCCLFTDSAKDLGHIKKPGSLIVDEACAKSLSLLHQIRNVVELGSFLGLWNMYDVLFLTALILMPHLQSFLERDSRRSQQL